ncbi:RNA polymerase II-associated protein RBA50 [Paramyrothecium foliicola]|nr:RNA polymerase II-associated protein RBA50 [Paramyrothecium foliicola]
MDLIGEIVERDLSGKKPVEFSDVPSTNGFPQLKKRWTQSAFKQRRAGAAQGKNSSDPSPTGSKDDHTKPGQNAPAQMSFEQSERSRIDQENRQKLDNMSPQEIAQAQEDLMTGLNPALIQRLLRRANIDEPSSSSPFEPTARPSTTSPQSVPEIKIDDTSKHSNDNVQPTAPTNSAEPVPDTDVAAEDREPQQPPSDLPPQQSTHFPAPPKVPDLDPSDPDFLANLHEKYFPDLPSDPSKLAWMAPVPTENSPADKESPYYPHPEISISALRFDFRGRFLTPRVSRSIPTSKGLHHHGVAPESAGYTIAELAHLARSAVPAQRCIAYQTLGRILYRLGRGEWGTSVDDPIAMGIWSSMKEGRVLDSLTEAAMNEGGHRGSRAYATEAMWLFEKGAYYIHLDDIKASQLQMQNAFTDILEMKPRSPPKYANRAPIFRGAKVTGSQVQMDNWKGHCLKQKEYSDRILDHLARIQLCYKRGFSGGFGYTRVQSQSGKWSRCH